MSENEISTQLYDLRDMIDKQAEFPANYSRWYLFDDLLALCRSNVSQCALGGLEPSPIERILVLARSKRKSQWSWCMRLSSGVSEVVSSPKLENK